MRKSLILLSALSLALAVEAKSAKRGIGWDESTQELVLPMMQKMQPGVAWAYNWGAAPKVPDIYGSDSMAFLPMCWNGSFDEDAIRTYLTAHPETEYLLGFNEPNFSSQAAIGPSDAAELWPALEQIAADFNLKLVAPALNFSGEVVAGRIWSPYQWLNAFFRYYPDAKVDCLALHCYMDYASALNWFATEYFYSDLYDSSNTDAYGRFPYLVAYLDNYKAANGHFPKMMLTEFCAWEDNVTGVDFQIDQMTKKVQMLEQSPLVEGYAWFMGNVAGGAAAYPYESVFQSNTALSELSELGKVYVNMSDFSTERAYAPDTTFYAKDYVDASTDYDVVLRSCTDAASDAPLQVQLGYLAYVEYVLSVPDDGTYQFSIRALSDDATQVQLILDGSSLASQQFDSTGGEWTDLSFSIALTAGEHRLRIKNVLSTSLYINSLSYTILSSVPDIAADNFDVQPTYYNLQGMPVKEDALTTGVYVCKCANDVRKVLIK